MYEAGAVEQDIRVGQLVLRVARSPLGLRTSSSRQTISGLFPGKSFEGFPVDIGRPHDGAFLSKGDCRRPSNSLSRGRYHGGLARQPSTHPFTLARRRCSTPVFDSNW